MDALNIGITGRKTGLRIEDTGERDEYGMEPMDAFFSPDVSRAEHKGSTKKGLSGSGTKRQNSRVDGATPSTQKKRQKDSDNLARILDFKKHPQNGKSLFASYSGQNDDDELPDTQEIDESETEQLQQQKQRKKKSATRLKGQTPITNGARGRSHRVITPEPEPENSYDEDDDDYESEQSDPIIPADDIPFKFGFGSDEEVARGKDAEEEEEPVKPLRNSRAKKNPAATTTRRTTRNNTKEVTKPLKTTRSTAKSTAPITRANGRANGKARITKNPLANTTTKSVTKPKKQDEKKEIILDGLRRSSRRRMEPLKFWRGEKVVYHLEHEGNMTIPDIAEVVHIPSPPPQERKPYKRYRYKSSKNRRKFKNDDSDESEVDEEPISGTEWEEVGQFDAEVLDYPNEDTKVSRVVAFSNKKIPYNQVKNANFELAILFDENKEFTASGMIKIPPGGVKSKKLSGDTYFVFYVVEGRIEITLNDQTFVCRKGASFEVPMGNFYSFDNKWKKECKLFFSQSKYILLADSDGEVEGTR